MRKILTLLIFCAAILAWTAAARAEGVWRLDGSNANELPRNFRIDEELKASGAGQPSLAGLKLLYENLRERTGGKIYMVDVRQESHGFFNGYPASYYVEKNLANYFLLNDGIEDIEIEQLNDALDRQIELVPLGNFDKAHFQPVNLFVTEVLSERQVAENLGFEYIRLGGTDMLFPSPDVVDAFIQFVANIEDDAWFHVHCQAGQGRTTLFLVMYDILKNPDKSLSEICERQKMLGGSDLLTRRVGDPKDYYVQAHNDRAEKLIEFFFYVRGTQREEIGLPWSEYILTRGR
ncbi:MAG: hypothetical protein J5809_01460 [Selenomonadaceae bacterium]|nr:hypothetical protein [Selenomonadaceae bacterium]